MLSENERLSCLGESCSDFSMRDGGVKGGTKALGSSKNQARSTREKSKFQTPNPRKFQILNSKKEFCRARMRFAYSGMSNAIARKDNFDWLISGNH
jgi:hypothetical protein